MTLWLLITQCILYGLSVLFSFSLLFTALYSSLVISAILTAASFILSLIFAWCPLTVLLLIFAVLLLLFAFGHVSEIFSCDVTLVGPVFIILLFFVIYFFGIPYVTTGEISKLETSVIEIYSASDKGISDTQFFGGHNLLFGRVSGSTYLTYYYSFYRMNEEGNLIIDSIPADQAEICTIPNNEQPYIKVTKTYHKAKHMLTNLPSDKEELANTHYEIYIPESAIPNTFNFDIE